MSKDTLTEKDKGLANAIVGIYKNVEDMTLIGAEYNERNYKLFTSRVIELKLDKTIKDLEDTYNNYVKKEDKDNG